MEPEFPYGLERNGLSKTQVRLMNLRQEAMCADPPFFTAEIARFAEHMEKTL